MFKNGIIEINESQTTLNAFRLFATRQTCHISMIQEPKTFSFIKNNTIKSLISFPPLPVVSLFLAAQPTHAFGPQNIPMCGQREAVSSCYPKITQQL